MNIEQEIVFFKGLVAQMAETFAKKRADYGPSTTETWKKFGPVSMLTRMHDKMGRLDNLMAKGNNNCPLVADERVEDTLLDLANYAIITILEMHKEATELRGDTIGREVDCREGKTNTTTCRGRDIT